MTAQPLSIAQPHHPVGGQCPARRRDRIRQTLNHLRERRSKARPSPGAARGAALPLRPHRRKRKAALALSAGAVGLGSAAMSFPERGASATMAMDASETRRPAGQLSASDAFREALIKEEGVRRTVYLDAAGLPTVGVGHLVTPGDGLRAGQAIGFDRVLDLFDRDLTLAERAVVRLVGDLPLFQHEFDALVDLVYNVGEGGVSVGNSPRLNAAIAEGDYRAMAAELAYHHAGGGEVSGLVARSERRTSIFTDAAYEDPREASAGHAVRA